MRRLLPVLLFSAACVLMAGPSQAYNGGSAASYADTYWNSRPTNFPSFSDDCTNFTSQAIKAGGLGFRSPSFTTTGAYNNNAYWFAAYQGGGWTWSYSWSVANSQYLFLSVHVSGTTAGYNAVGTTSAYTPSWHTKGSPVYYDWNDDGTIDHASLYVGSGTDTSSGFSGDLIDQHTNDRLHAIWHLRPYNQQYATTSYYFVNIPGSVT